MNVQSLPAPNKTTTLFSLGVLLILTLLFTCAFLAPERLLDLFNLGAASWQHDQVAEVLGVAIPDEARELRLAGTPDDNGYLNMSFEASPQVIADFVASFCAGVRHTGYDPFNAIDRRLPAEGAVPLDMAEARYYSYSPGLTGSVSGNRCWDEGGVGQLEFVIDQRDPQMYRLYLEHRPNCYKCSLPNDEE